MFARITIAVMLFALCGSSAQAGLMVRELSDSEQLGDSRQVSSASTDRLPSEEADKCHESRLQGPGSDFAAVSPPSPGSGGAHAALAVFASPPRLAGLRWQVSVGNNSLPPQPLLGGLLKPS